MYVQFTSRGYPFKTILRYFINAFQSKDHVKFLYSEKEVVNFGRHGQPMKTMLGYYTALKGLKNLTDTLDAAAKLYHK